MRPNLRNSNRRRFFTVLYALAISTGPTALAAGAQSPDATPEVAAQPRKPLPRGKTARATINRQMAAKAAGSYFVEFRSRYALSYGHTFLVHGKLNASGEIGKVTADQVAGLHPAGDSPIPWLIGHIAPVVSETGPSDGDLEDQYVSARYRVTLDKTEYEKTAAFIKQLQASSPVWHAVAYNCNAFVADVARSMGLQAPMSTMLFPADFINGLREVNSDQASAERVGYAQFER